MTVSTPFIRPHLRNWQAACGIYEQTLASVTMFHIPNMGT
jgi:hypothetical protein